MRTARKTVTARRAQARAAELSRLPILEFIPRISPDLIAPDYLAPLLDVLERARRGERVRAVVSVPAQHGKTFTILHFLVWWLAQCPADPLAYVTYSDGQAASKSDLAHQLADVVGLDLRRDTLGEWRTSMGGGCLWSGVGGKLTGQPARCIIVDDPYKNRVEADSPAARAKVLGWFKSVVLTRGQEGMSIIVVHTRWNDGDLIGTLKRGECGDFEEINLPFLGRLDPETGKVVPDNKGNIVLNPLRTLPDGRTFGWSVEGAQQHLEDVGEYDAASIYQGEPRPKGGKVFSKILTRYETVNVEGARIILAVDPAGGEGASANHTVAVALACRGAAPKVSADLVGLARWQGRPESIAPKLLAFQKRWGAALNIESSRDGRELARVLRLLEPALRIILVPAIGSKFLRAQPIAAASNASPARFRIPLHARLIGATERDLSELVRVVEGFTGVGDTEDDDVDALAHGFNLASVPTTTGTRLTL